MVLLRVTGCKFVIVVFVEQEETAITVCLLYRRGIIAFIDLTIPGVPVIFT